MNEAKFGMAIALGLFQQVRLDPLDGKNLSTDKAYKAAVTANKKTPPVVENKDVFGAASIRDFVRRIAPLISGANVGGTQDVEKYMSGRMDSQGNVIVTSIEVLSAGGGRPRIPASANFVIHTHIHGSAVWDGRVETFDRAPGPGDNAVVKARGIPNYVVQDRSKNPRAFSRYSNAYPEFSR